VFVSEEELEDSFWGPSTLNPFDQFNKVQPSRAIAGEILEFDGSFDVPMITAESQYVIAQGLLYQQKADQALPHAEKAVALDPNSINAHEALSAVYAAQHQSDAAEREYQVAEHLFQQVPPGYANLMLPPQDPLVQH
jgi:tetratricopeptide (TPR) repeat protein